MNFSNTTTPVPMPISYYAAALPHLKLIYQTMNLYLSIFILIPGWFLNFVMAGVFMRKKFWKRNDSNNGYYYLIYPLVSNLCVTIAILNFFPAAFGRDLTLVGGVAACRLIWFLRLFFVTFSQYFQIQMTIDRTINIVYPKRFIWLSKILNLLKLTGVVMILSALYGGLQVFRYYVYKVTIVNNTTIIQIPTSCVLPTMLLRVYNFTFFTIRLSGFIIALVANIIIIRKLVVSKKMSNSGISSKEFAFAVSLLCTNFLHTILVAPFLGILCVQLSYALEPNPPADFVAFANQLYSISNWGNYIYEAVPFYINLASNKVFRAELRIMMSRGRPVANSYQGGNSRLNTTIKNGGTGITKNF